MLKKKLFATLLAGTMIAGMMAGCGSSDGSAPGTPDTAGSSSADAAASDGAYDISVIVKLTDGHFTRIMAGVQAYADEHDNVNVEIVSPSSATA